MNIEKASVSANKSVLKYVDILVKQNDYRSRSHAFDEALKLLKEKEESFLERLREGKLK